ncbi:MAG: hypothetical protein AAFV85_13645 [Cyanobacteria bacterium J06634_6]
MKALLYKLAFSSLLALTHASPGKAFSLLANATPSQFTPRQESFFESDTGFLNSSPLSVALTSPSGNARAGAFASPTLLSVSTSTANTGVNVPAARAEVREVGLSFGDNAALRNLIPDGSDRLELLLNFDISYSLDAGPSPGIFSQALADTDVSLVSNSLTGLLAVNSSAN